MLIILKAYFVFVFHWHYLDFFGMVAGFLFLRLSLCSLARRACSCFILWNNKKGILYVCLLHNNASQNFEIEEAQNITWSFFWRLLCRIVTWASACSLVPPFDSTVPSALSSVLSSISTVVSRVSSVLSGIISAVSSVLFSVPPSVSIYLSSSSDWLCLAFEDWISQYQRIS